MDSEREQRSALSRQESRVLSPTALQRIGKGNKFIRDVPLVRGRRTLFPENLHFSLSSRFEPLTLNVAPSTTATEGEEIGSGGIAQISSVLDALYQSRPSFVSPIDGFQVMRDVYHLVDLAAEHDDANNGIQHAEIDTNSDQGQVGAIATVGADSKLMHERDQQCWKSVRHAVQVIEEALSRYGYGLRK